MLVSLGICSSNEKGEIINHYMEIKFLKAGTGDSILISHKKKNILVDGGNDSQYLLKEIIRINEAKQKIDLLIITHHDDDHIKGIIDLLKMLKSDESFKNEKKFIGQVIFNSPRMVLGKITGSKKEELSYAQAFEIEELLAHFDVEWKLSTELSNSIEFSGMKIDILSPTKKDLNTYSNNNGAYLTGDQKCDWKTPLRILEKYLSDKSQDISVPNKSSTVLNVICEGKKILLTGDVTPARLNTILEQLVEDNNGDPVHFDFVKLPHHGSYRSLNEDILKKIKCTNFIICTNGRRHYHPNKRALLKIVKYSESNDLPINFMFTYQEVISELLITEKEKKDYNFQLVPNNRSYGFSI